MLLCLFCYCLLREAILTTFETLKIEIEKFEIVFNPDVYMAATDCLTTHVALNTEILTRCRYLFICYKTSDTRYTRD